MPSPKNTVTTVAKRPVQTVGQATEIAGMQGIAAWGPEDDPFLVTSMTEFEEIAGPRIAAFPMLYDSASAFFTNGGRRLYINRTLGVGGAASSQTTQANAQDTIVNKGRYKGARGNTISRKYTQTSIPAGTVASAVVAGSTTVIPVTAPNRFNIGDQVSFTAGADVKRGIIAAINGTSIVLAQAIVVPVGGYSTTTTVLIENYRLDVYDNNVLKSSYFNLQTSPLSPFHYATVVGNDDYRIMDSVPFSPAPTFAANTDTRPSTDANPVLLTAGADGATPTDAAFKGTSAAFTGIWAWDRKREVLFLSAPGILSIAGITVDVYKEAEVFERYRQERSPVLYIVDPPSAQTPAQMKTWWTTTLAATSRGMSVWYPWLRRRDPITGLVVARPPSGYIMGLIVEAQRLVNIAQAPAGDLGNIRGVLGTELDVPLQEGDARYDDLYDVGVNAILRFEAASPAKAYGNKTADSLGSFSEFHLTVVFAIAQREVKKRTSFVNFRFNDRETRAQVTRVVRGYFQELYRAGVLDGDSEDQAFFIQCDESNNPPSARAQRKLFARYGLNVKHLAEFVFQTLEQDTRAIDAELGSLARRKV